jgi:hypothetical protein
VTERDVLPNLGPYGVPFFSAENENPSSPWYPHEFFSHPGRRESLTSPAAKPIEMWLLGDEISGCVRVWRGGERDVPFLTFT